MGIFFLCLKRLQAVDYFYLKPVFIASHSKLKKLRLILNSEYANTKLACFIFYYVHF